MGEKKIREFLTFDEFREHFRSWSNDTIRRRIKNENFPAIWDGGTWVIPAEAARNWFKKREQ